MAKSDFEKIVAQYAEMMATAASIVPECVDLINNYRKNNYDATTKYIKDICMGKYELQYLLGLGGTQMQTVTVGMAAFLCCGSKHDKNFLTTMVTAYSNSPKIIKLHLLQTEIYSLFIDVLKKCAETGAIASLDIQSGKINDETRAFAFAYFLSVAPNKSFEEAVIRTFVESDVRSAIVPPAKKSSRFAYLMHTTVKDRFHDKNLKHILLTDVRRPSNGRNFNLYNNEIASRWEINLKSFGGTLSNDGMLNGGSLEEFVLTKADVMAIASVAYNAVHLDEEQLPLEEIWASCDGDSSNEYDSDDVEQAKRLRQEFEYALFNATYYHYLCKQCRRQSLSNLNNYFFNPQGLKLDAELKKCNRQIERDKALIQSQKEVLESLTVRANVAEKSATEARNRYAAIQSKVESQQSKIDVLQKELSLLRAENEELRHILPAPESLKYAPAKVEPEINYADMLAAIFTNKKIVFIGGHQNIMSKFSQKYPDAVVIPHDKAVLANQPLEAADAVLFKTDSMGHKEYNPIKDLADRRNIPIGYIGDFTSLTLVEKSVYEELTKLGLLQ